MARTKHLKVTAQGNLVAGEVWSCSFALGYSGEAINNDTTLGTVALAGIEVWRSVFGIPALTAFGESLTSVVVRSYNDAGLLIAQTERAPAGGSLQGNGTIKMPPQAAVVISLQTIIPGAKGRGRMYLPLLAITLDTGGRIPSTTVTDIVEDFGGALNTMLTGIAAGGLVPGVFLGVASGLGPGAVYPVSKVRVGNVVDTQRRRRDALPESYQSNTINAPAD